MIKNFPTSKFNTIVLDPAWNIPLTGKVKVRPNRKEKLDYESKGTKRTDTKQGFAERRSK